MVVRPAGQQREDHQPAGGSTGRCDARRADAGRAGVHLDRQNGQPRRRRAKAGRHSRRLDGHHERPGHSRLAGDPTPRDRGTRTARRRRRSRGRGRSTATEPAGSAARARQRTRRSKEPDHALDGLAPHHGNRRRRSPRASRRSPSAPRSGESGSHGPRDWAERDVSTGRRCGGHDARAGTPSLSGATSAASAAEAQGAAGSTRCDGRACAEGWPAHEDRGGHAGVTFNWLASRRRRPPGAKPRLRSRPTARTLSSRRASGSCHRTTVARRGRQDKASPSRRVATPRWPLVAAATFTRRRSRPVPPVCRCPPTTA